MTPVAADVALAIGGSFAGSIVTKATFILAFALIGIRLARRRRAAVRHVLLVAAFAVLLVLPIASAVAPLVPLEVPIVASSIAASLTLASPTAPDPAAASVVTGSSERARTPSSRLSASALLLTGWAAGALLCLVPVLVGLWQTRTLRQSGRPWPHGQSLVEQLAADADIRRRVNVLLDYAIPGPVSCGIAPPIIVLPTDTQTWDADDLGRAVVHELEHIRRGDWATQCLARVVCACYWFHPLVWMAWRQLVLEAERACDDAVLRRISTGLGAGADATAYANQLVELADRLSTAPSRSLLAMAKRTDLATRVVAVLDSRQSRGRAGIFSLGLVSIASALLVTTISPLRLVTAAQVSETTQTFAGSLRDPVGRPLPNDGFVTLVNVSTQQRIDTRGDDAGRFTFSGVPMGEYLLKAGGFESPERIIVAPGQHLNRDIALEWGGVLEYAVAVQSSDAPTVLPAPPSPLPPPSRPSQPYTGQMELDRCRQASMFCRISAPVPMSRPQPVYPTKQRENGVGGTVILEGRIGTDGLLKDLRALAPADSDFASAAVDALRHWQIKPVQLDDIPLEMKIRVTANFVVQ